MAPLAVDPTALNAAGVSVVAVGEGLGSVISTLTTALAGCAGMAGDDPVGSAFGRAYDQSAGKVLEGLAAVRNTLCHLGDGVRMSAHNYSMAEAASNVSGRGAVLPVPPATGRIPAGSSPSAVGGTVTPPSGWGWVVKFLGMIYPTGDSARLRAAATAWGAAAESFQETELGVSAPLVTVRAQQIPEQELMTAALQNATTNTVGMVGHCLQIAAQLHAYADRIDKVHKAIWDLLKRICNPATGLKEIWQKLTRQDEDEIKKIADDIRTVINNFKAEVDVLSDEIWKVGHAIDKTITTTASSLGKQWGEYFHSSDASPVEKFAWGVAEEAGGLVAAIYGFVDEASTRGLVPTVEEKLEGAAPLVGLGGQGAPGVAETWKELGKDAVHWDEWSTNGIPETAGKVLFDFGLPGRTVKKVTEAGGLGKHPPHVETPPAERPPAPPGKPPTPPREPVPAPPGSQLPHSPVEPKPPVEKPAVAPKPSAPTPGRPSSPVGSHEPTGRGHPVMPVEHAPQPPSAAPTAQQHLLSGGPRPPASPHMPAEPASLAGHTPHSAPAAPDSAPHGPIGGAHPNGGHPGEPLSPHQAGSDDGFGHSRFAGDQSDHAGEHGSSDHHPDQGGPAVDTDYYPPGSLPSYGELQNLTRTDPDKSHYWSGRDASGVGVGPGGSGMAERLAGEAHGTTLEMLLEKNGLSPLPRWNELDPEAVRFWEDASAAYAENASGTVTAVVGSNMRPGNVWEAIEIPRLINNQNVTKIIQINPDTGQVTVILER